MRNNPFRAFFFIFALICVTEAYGDYEIRFEGTTTVNAGGGDFAPYYIMSNSGGMLTQPVSVYESLKIDRPISKEKRFDYSFGLEGSAGWNKGTSYRQFHEGEFNYIKRHQPYIVLNQLYGEVKYRSLFASFGMKEDDRSLYDSPLSVGDIVVSKNARPIPQLRIGFIDFQDIPLTKKWVQVSAELSYGKFTDSGWLKNHYNYYNSFITTGAWFHYKRLCLRTNPEKPFSFMVGMEHAAQFGGDYRVYTDGKLTYQKKQKVTFGDFVDAFMQRLGDKGAGDGDSQFIKGNHLGSWDLKASYRFRDGSLLTASAQMPWEDGSGIGKLNGWDGVWGLRYDFNRDGIVTSVMAEYIDFTNQSGPIHWAPTDHPGTAIPGEATGADDYYNNFMYNGWENYGMSIGTPFIPGTVYNRNGYLRVTDNRIRGFQIGLSGNGVKGLEYRLLVSHRTSWGTPMIPSASRRHDFSLLLEAKYSFERVPGLSLKGAFALDHGTLLGNNTGVLFALSYACPIIFKSKR